MKMLIAILVCVAALTAATETEALPTICMPTAFSANYHRIYDGFFAHGSGEADFYKNCAVYKEYQHVMYYGVTPQQFTYYQMFGSVWVVDHTNTCHFIGNFNSTFPTCYPVTSSRSVVVGKSAQATFFQGKQGNGLQSDYYSIVGTRAVGHPTLLSQIFVSTNFSASKAHPTAKSSNITTISYMDTKPYPGNVCGMVPHTCKRAALHPDAKTMKAKFVEGFKQVFHAHDIQEDTDSTTRYMAKMQTQAVVEDAAFPPRAHVAPHGHVAPRAHVAPHGQAPRAHMAPHANARPVNRPHAMAPRAKQAPHANARPVNRPHAMAPHAKQAPHARPVNHPHSMAPHANRPHAAPHNPPKDHPKAAPHGVAPHGVAPHAYPKSVYACPPHIFQTSYLYADDNSMTSGHMYYDNSSRPYEQIAVIEAVRTVSDAVITGKFLHTMRTSYWISSGQCYTFSAPSSFLNCAGPFMTQNDVDGFVLGQPSTMLRNYASNQFPAPGKVFSYQTFYQTNDDHLRRNHHPLLVTNITQNLNVQGQPLTGAPSTTFYFNTTGTLTASDRLQFTIPAICDQVADWETFVKKIGSPKVRKVIESRNL